MVYYVEAMQRKDKEIRRKDRSGGYDRQAALKSWTGRKRSGGEV